MNAEPTTPNAEHRRPNAKRICVCSTQIPFVWGGSEIFFDNLVARLRQRGHEVETVRLPLQMHPHEELVKSCLAWRLLNVDSSEFASIDLVIGTRFPSYLLRHPNKIIWLQHQHRQIYDFYGTPYTSFLDSSSDNQMRHYIMDLDEMAFGEARKIFSQSKTVAERLKHFNGFESEVLYPPIDDAESFYFQTMGNSVLSVARLAGNKRVHLLIEAMQYVSPEFEAVVIGEGYAAEEYRRLVSSLHLKERVRFLGRVPRKEVIDWYARTGAVFYGPIGEDYGYATLEAFYARKPVITCTDSGGTLEFVDSTTGWIAEPEPRAIAACIEEALTNKTGAAERGEAGFRRISFLHWDHVLDQLLQYAGK